MSSAKAESIIKSYRNLPLGEEKPISICLLNPDTSVIGFNSGQISIVDLNLMTITKSFQTTLNLIESLTFYTETQFFVGSEEDIVLFDTSFQILNVLKGHKDSVVKLNMLDSILYSASEDNTVRSWNIHKGQSTIIYSHESAVLTMDLSHSSSMIASTCSEKDLYLFNIREDRIINSLKSLDYKIWALKFIEFKNKIALGTHDSEIILKTIPSLETIKVLTGHTSRIKDLFYDSKLDLLVSGSFDQSIGIWDLKSMSLKEFLNIHEDWVRKVVLDERGILSVGDDKVLRLAEIDRVKKGDCQYWKWLLVLAALLIVVGVIFLWVSPFIKDLF